MAAQLAASQEGLSSVSNYYYYYFLLPLSILLSPASVLLFKMPWNRIFPVTS
jgi:hypothetical protein